MATAEVEMANLKTRLIDIEREKKGYYRQNAQGLLNDNDLREFLKELETNKIDIEKRLDELIPVEPEPETLPADLLQELRRRLDNGLSEEQRQEIARLLVKQIVIQTKTEDGNRYCKAEIKYRFIGAVNNRTGRDSSRRPA
jgi:molecular chaperone DnaK (HSP70)